MQQLIDDNQIIRLEKCPDDLFISPVVISVKKDKSIKIALDSKKLNKAIHKNKYQMQSIEHLTDSLAMHISANKSTEGPWFGSVKLTLNMHIAKYHLTKASRDIATSIYSAEKQQEHIDL